MSHLNISLSSFGNSSVRGRHGYPLRTINLDLGILVRAILSALHSKPSDMAVEQVEQLVTDAQNNTCAQDATQGCIDHVSDAEYQHLVDLGHWHHRRQRRRARWS